MNEPAATGEWLLMGYFRRALLCAPICALSLSGCAISYVDDDDRIHVLGFAEIASDPDIGQDTLSGDYLSLRVYGLWLETAFSDPFLSVGYAGLSAATLRNAWGTAVAHASPPADDGCESDIRSLWFVDCTLSPINADNASGYILDGSMVGLGFGGAKDLAGDDVFRFTVGYSRNLVVAVANDVAICGDPRIDLRAWETGEVDQTSEGSMSQCAEL